ncbi:metal ABC transporter substrate-binding protein [Algihabitans sp.]|uniref:metal ABC transporter substrate-binding protein n=1 Tax=Algihabitans sp. TaxID=2821514 RepID=UPI003BABB615
MYRLNVYGGLRSFWSCAAAALLLTFASSAALSEARADERLRVVTTFTVVADIARNVAGEAAVVDSIIKPGAEVHDYQPTPRDIVRAQEADLLLWNGLNLERWFERFLRDVGDVPQVVVSEGVEPISIYQGPYSGKPNPHAWMSTANALIYVENIRRALVELDPDNADHYNSNAEAYAARIKDVGEGLAEVVAAIPEGQRFLVTSEGAFSYLARDLEMEEVFIWPINADQQGTPQQVRQVVDIVRENDVPVVFSESTISDRPARRVASETGALYGGVLYVDSLSGPDGPVPTYLELLQITTRTIADGFRNAMGL